MLTKWFSPHKSTIFAIICSILLLSCGTTNSSKSNKTAAKNTKLINKVETNISADQLMSRALRQNSKEAVSSFIQAGELYLHENKPHKALWLANQTEVLTEQPLQKYKLALVTAKSLLALEQVEKAYQTLAQANNIVDMAELTHSADYYQTLASVQVYRQLPIAALDASLSAFAINKITNKLIDNDDNTELNGIWQQLSRLSQWQHQQLVKMNPPNIKGWSKLLSFANKFGDDDTRFQRYLTQWQREFSEHPAQHIVAQLQQPTLDQENTSNRLNDTSNMTTNIDSTKVSEHDTALNTEHSVSDTIGDNKSFINNTQANNNNNKEIAIIIPLSGMQERAGKVVQQGILAAYNNNSDTTLHFIDSVTLNMTTLAEQLTRLNINYVIGPLLKSNVKKYLAQEDITVPTLLLNLPSTAALKPHQVALSMRPEDEAIQAATTLSRLTYQHPLILSHQDKSSRRIAKTFSEQWQHITGNAPETVFFNNDEKMQQQLKSSLGVDLSQQQTKALDNLIKYSIKSELRNRRDIDIIYIVGSSLETKLLKPYIDVNISPFADLIPVYASSRSHSATSDKSDKRDLSGLIFTEMPWKIPSKQQNKALAEQAKVLWPNRNDSLQTIFAMGFDSLSLIDKITSMKNKPYVRHYGQTGILQLDENNILKRSLVWGKYSRNMVQEIALD